MFKAEDIIKLIDSVEATPKNHLYLMAYTDYEEQKFKEMYPGVEILRVPQRFNDDKSSI